MLEDTGLQSSIIPVTVIADTKNSRAISSNNIVRYLKRSEASKGSQADKGSQAVKRSEASCDIIEQYRAVPEAKSREVKH